MRVSNTYVLREMHVNTIQNSNRYTLQRNYNISCVICLNHDNMINLTIDLSMQKNQLYFHVAVVKCNFCKNNINDLLPKINDLL